ncbi:hypothetical protein [Romboutsia maritimum]|uniref:hypothetical protein n=1 Tax=Romboutsia maritimum TaxID=2020948 RepID=UPI0013148D08|nr:hypothetical protein [Romboutsia maritimum]
MYELTEDEKQFTEKVENDSTNFKNEVSYLHQVKRDDYVMSVVKNDKNKIYILNSII